MNRKRALKKPKSTRPKTKAKIIAKVSVPAIIHKLEKLEVHDKQIETKLQSMSKKDAFKTGNPTRSDYMSALINPEMAYGPRFPMDGFSKPCTPMSRKVTIRSTTNLLGNLYFIWQCNYLSDNSAGLSTFGINNNALYDGVAAGLNPANLLAVALNYSLPTSNVEAYRFVCGSMTMTFEASNTLRTGRAFIAKHQYQTPTGVVNGANLVLNPFGTADVIFSNIDNYQPSCAGQLGNGDVMRAIYTPVDIHDTEFSPINIEVDASGSGNEDCVVGYIANATPSTAVTFDFWLHYEILPQSGSAMAGMETIGNETSDLKHVLIDVNRHPEIICNKMSTAARFGGISNMVPKILSNQESGNNAIKAEQQLKPIHYPGYNYLGPGTQIFTNLVNGVKPLDSIDRLAMYHDLEYVKGNFALSDMSAIVKSYGTISLPAIAMRAGLLVRMATGYKPQNIYNNNDIDKLYETGQFLADNINK